MEETTRRNKHKIKQKNSRTKQQRGSGRIRTMRINGLLLFFSCILTLISIGFVAPIVGTTIGALSPFITFLIVVLPPFGKPTIAKFNSCSPECLQW